MKSSAPSEPAETPRVESGHVRTLRVWDLPTRLFHWLLVALVVLAWMIVGDDGWKLTVHTVAGYGVLVALFFRLGWGFIGSIHARFADFLRPWSVVRDYASQLARRTPPPYIGHNPLGGHPISVIIRSADGVSSCCS